MEDTLKVTYEEAVSWVKDYMERKHLSQTAMAKVCESGTVQSF